MNFEVYTETFNYLKTYLLLMSLLLHVFKQNFRRKAVLGTAALFKNCTRCLVFCPTAYLRSGFPNLWLVYLLLSTTSLRRGTVEAKEIIDGMIIVGCASSSGGDALAARLA